MQRSTAHYQSQIAILLIASLHVGCGKGVVEVNGVGVDDTTATSEARVVVNVRDTWCNGNCWEGHDLAQCLCVRKADSPDRDPSGWLECRSLPCCSAPTVTCGRSEDCTYDSRDGVGEPTLIEVEQGTCMRSNETGIWSWAAFWSYVSGADTCDLATQSPWDDTGGPLECAARVSTSPGMRR